METEVDVKKKHFPPDLGKGDVDPEGAPTGEAVDGLGDETIVLGSLAFLPRLTQV